jgi:hypothetical protein
MPDLPARVGPVVAGPATQQERQAVAARRGVERAIYGHELETFYRTEVALVEMRAAGEVTISALDSEMGVYAEAMEQAAGSAAMTSLIADHLQDLKEANRRIFRETFR